MGQNGQKERYTAKNGATTVALRQRETYYGTDRVTVADSWFSTDELWSVL